jgi:hypothetical protein
VIKKFNEYNVHHLYTVISRDEYFKYENIFADSWYEKKAPENYFKRNEIKPLQDLVGINGVHCHLNWFKQIEYVMQVEIKIGSITNIIFKSDDEWFIIKSYPRNIRNGDLARSTTYFKCDQVEGILEYLKERIEEHA